MAHTGADLLLVGVTFLGLALLAAAYLAFQSWGFWALVPLFVVMCFVICTNYQCTAHNFVHNEFFAARWMNDAFSVLNTLALGFSQTIFREHHLNHHKHNNAPLARDGSAGDLSSLRRYSGDEEEDEPFLKYILLSPLRADILSYARAAIRRKYKARLVAEAAALVLFWLFLLAVDWRFALMFYLPLVYLGHVMTYAEGYFEHHKTTPGDRMRNAVSCYGALYNWFWFNNGYHQEHHCYPAVHWTEIPEYREKMLSEDERRVVSYAHWVNF
ncbi:MAG: fatty acid desaturase [Pseudomonadota bacterium]